MPRLRLSRLLAEAGVVSRHRAEQWIAAGRVRVNGRVVSDPASWCDPGRDRVEVDGRPVAWPPPRVYVALHKPAGYVTTLDDPHASDTVAQLVGGVGIAVHPVGRLDADSRGLLLLTNDGELTHRLTHPRHHVVKVYDVLVRGRPSAQVLDDLRRGVPLADGVSRFGRVEVIRETPEGTWLRVALAEGRNRQIRRTLATVGHPVQDLVRIAFGPVELGDLPAGRWRHLTATEVAALRRAAGLAGGAGGRGRAGTGDKGGSGHAGRRSPRPPRGG